MTRMMKIDLQTCSVYNISAKCAFIVALHHLAVSWRLTRINKTKTATSAKRKVSAQRFRKQLLISLPLSRPVARLIMNAPRRRRAIKRQGFLILLGFVGNWDGGPPYSSYRAIQKSCNRCAAILIRYVCYSMATHAITYVFLRMLAGW